MMAHETEVDSCGVLVYDFEMKHPDNIPVSDFQELLKRLDDKAYAEPTYETASVAKGRRVIFIPPRLIITGEAVSLGVTSITQNWEDYLPNRIFGNLMQKCSSPNRLSTVQRWISTVISFDFPGVIFCGNGHFTSDVMIISLAARVYNVSKSRIFSNFYNSANCTEDAIGKEAELQKRRPHTILICQNIKAGNSMQEKLKWIFKGTRITWEYVTSEVVDSNVYTKPCDLLVGTARTIRDYIKKFDVSMFKLDSVYVTNCHLYRPKSTRSRALTELFELLKPPFSSFFFYRKHMEVHPFFEKMLPPDYTTISMPPRTISGQANVKICFCSEEFSLPDRNLNSGTFRKLSWVNAIVEKIRASNAPRLNKATLIVCQTSERACYLATYLMCKYNYVFPCITEESHMVSIERARNLLSSRTTDFMILDYQSVALLEGGHVANTVLYDLPPAPTFLKNMHILSKLSEKIEEGKRQVYLILDPEEDTDVIIPAHEYVTAMGGKISQTFEAFYNSLL